MIFAALHVLFAYQGHSFEREELRYFQEGFHPRTDALSVIETYCNTFQSLMQLRGGFVMVDPSVRRLRRPVAGLILAAGYCAPTENMP